MSIQDIDPEQLGNKKLFKLLLEGVAPRPIAFASTIDKEGNPNLAPFSFYNAFGVNPSTLVFSPSRRGRDNTTKHTFDNLKEVPEVVLNAVSYDMVQQMSLTGAEYPKGVNEFEKAGFTAVPSQKVKPFRVKESKLQFECRVRDIIETSGKAGSGNLVVCEIVQIHLDTSILDKNGNIDPDKLDLVGRMGGDYYVRASGSALFTVPKPLTTLGIGVDALPGSVQNSKVLTGNDLGQLGNMEQLPSEEDLTQIRKQYERSEVSRSVSALHREAQNLIKKNQVFDALKLLLAFS